MKPFIVVLRGVGGGGLFKEMAASKVFGNLLKES